MIAKFIKQFKRSPRMLMKFSLVKYILLPLLNLLRVRDKGNLIYQIDLFKQILREDSFCIIILDACRYDFFKEIYRKYIEGGLLKVRSFGSDTGSFLKGLVNLPEFRELRVFSSSPHMSNTSILRRWLNSPNFPLGLDIIALWKIKWNEDIGTVLPENVNHSVIEYGLSNRNIIWYTPPHFPWIEDVDFSKDLINKSIKKRKPLSEIISKKIRNGEISKRRIRQLYILNLEHSLRPISKLLKTIGNTIDRIVVTSDHGELLGEYGLFFHYSNLDAPQLYTVPWLNIQS